MDSITQIVLGAAVGEAVAGKKMGGKAALWGAIAGTIPDLDVFFRAFVHPIEGALLHRGFSHSILFAVIASPILAFLVHRLYKKRYDYKTWVWLFFGSIITHPMLDIFTNYGTQFFWPFELRWTFNSVFVVDPLYTIPFALLLIIALFLKRENRWRRKLNYAGIVYSSLYLVWCVIVKLTILNKSDDYFQSAGIKGENTIVTPMPFTSFYWMMLTESDSSYYIGYKSLFYDFNPNDIEIIAKNHEALEQLKWKDKNYTETFKFLSNGYYSTELKNDTLCLYDLRFGTTTLFTEGKISTPLFAYGMVIDNGNVNKTISISKNGLWKEVNFGSYFNKIVNR
jgi:inner membrane protein